MKDPGSFKGEIYSLPWREFRADLISWLTAGALMAALYPFYFRAPFLTGVKVLLGCLSFGLFGGFLCFLSTEKGIIDMRKGGNMLAGDAPERIFSVSGKMIFFMVTVLLLMVIIILLMIFMDINYLLANRDAFGPGVFLSVFKEILFAFTVMIVLSLVILGRYSRNLKEILTVQMEAMERIGGGDYHIRVPVLSNDEFGVIAAKTNDMIRELEEKEVCQVSFGKYVSPEISERILKGEISPDGELAEATILFCDLRGYTPFVEKTDPKRVVEFLNAYFSEMQQAVKQFNGIVLQYIGDEIEAVFGTPVPEPDHPAMAVRAALEMRRRLHDLNETRLQSSREPIQHGIGIHTGPVLAGSVGSQERLVYAMVGAAVNAASRIQNLNKTFNTDILISSATQELLQTDEFELASLGMTSIKGKKEGIEIYRVL
jgi:adenylate cyclase